MGRRLRSLFAAALALALGACTSAGSGACFEGDQVSCSCAGGASGFRTCGADGQLGACACGPAGTGGGATGTGGASATGGAGGSGGADGGADGAAGDGGDGGLLPFLSPCTTNAQCDTGLCFDFLTKGPHCTKMCTSSADCPPPSPGCNPQGVCRAP